MDEETLKTMPDYVQKLPKDVRDFIFDYEWENRTQEIAVKYSLSESQTDLLSDKVLFVLIGLEPPENFLESIISELNISQLLAEQITEDLGKRVFEYAIKEIGSKTETIQEVAPEKVDEASVPEIRPTITPAIEEASPSFSNSVARPEGFGGEVTHPEGKDTSSGTGDNPVKETIAVPRYMPETPDNLPVAPITEPAQTQSAPTIDSFMPKPQQEGLEQTKPQTQPEVEQPKPAPQPIPEPPKKYTVDPYREPLE